MRDELEHLLDDNEDMAEMYLTEKLEEEQLDNSSTCSRKDQDIIDEEEDRYVKPLLPAVYDKSPINYLQLILIMLGSMLRT